MLMNLAIAAKGCPPGLYLCLYDSRTPPGKTATLYRCNENGELKRFKDCPAGCCYFKLDGGYEGRCTC